MADDSNVEQLAETLNMYRQEYQSLSASLEKETLDCISDMNIIANDVDKFHKGATITNVAGSALGIAGGITTIVGVVLAPFTLGASLIVSTVGIAVATAGGLTGASASIADTVNTKNKCNTVTKKIEKLNDMVNDLKKHASNISNLATHIQDKVNVSLQHQAADIARIGGKGVLAAVEITRLAQLGRIVTAAAQGVKLASQGARAIRAVSGVFAALFIIVDAYVLVSGSKELHRGAQTETAAEMRNKADELFEKCEEMKQHNRKLLAYIDSFIFDLRGE